MTEMLNKEFSRKSFVKGGGALIVGFSPRAAPALAGKAQAADEPVRVATARSTSSRSTRGSTINADNTASRQDGPGRARPGHRDRPADDRGRGARHGHRARCKFVIARHERRRRTRAARSASSAIADAAARAIRARRGDGEAGAARARRDEPRRAGREPDRRARASSRAAASPSPTAQLLGGKLFNVTMPRLRPTARRPLAAQASRRAGEAGQPVQARRHDARRGRHPGQGHRQAHYVQNIRVPGMLHGRVVRPRGQGAVRRRHAPRSSRSTRARSSTSRASQVVRKGDFLGVVAPTEYEAIQAAAQLKVKWAEPPKALPGQRQHVQEHARRSTRRQDAGSGSRRNDRQRRRGARRRRRKSSSQTLQATTTTATCRSARRAASPT